MGNDHHHHIHPSEISERRLWWAVSANILLTFAQVIGGLISNSLSLIADALHNFSDAASLLIALVAIRIARKPPDQLKTFGYKRAETIAALINLTTLIIIGLYLCYEAIIRFIAPVEIEGWTVVIVAGIALIVDTFTALLTYSQSKHSMNIKAAFLHNVSDALASIGVIIAGTLILLYGWIWTDAVMTLLISGYVLWQGFNEIPKVIHLLMEGTPEHINIDEVIDAMEVQDGVINVHHVHIWQLDERRNALEAHVVLDNSVNMDSLKSSLKQMLHDKFEIEHSTIEFENDHCG
ncbi:MAG: cation efflux system protein [Nitrosomonas sp.]|nr:MAG: cation efflux system protein [Nitrosomonas sp.]